MVLMPDGAHILMRVNEILWDIYSALCRKLRSAALSKVHVRNASVSTLCPRISRRIGIQVKPDVAHFVDPAQQVAVRICIASTLAAAHRDAQDVARLDLLHSSQGCHFAV